ncbi:hypothetical protein Q8A67_006866 [Cirrhinus molitorella]|uniref:ADP-ribosylation factor-like protein 4C n=2 Tax=Cyprinidae TaxID=7953 RepID=A0AA88TUX7_9TELE|nr:hypothetical protein Q8A67_006866 [Cirrhinus molitorella]
MGNSFSNISAFQSLHIVMLGLDSAGKTTVLYRLKFNEFVNTVPTIGFNTEKIKLSNGTAKGISCHFWDVGGQEKLRPLWKSYSRCTDGIIYVVDSVDVDRLEEAKTELHKVTKFAENQGTPLLVIANKQDLPKSLSVADIEKQLALQELTPATTYHIQPACAIIGEGLHEGMDKLEQSFTPALRFIHLKGEESIEHVLSYRSSLTSLGTCWNEKCEPPFISQTQKHWPYMISANYLLLKFKFEVIESVNSVVVKERMLSRFPSDSIQDDILSASIDTNPLTSSFFFLLSSLKCCAE